MEQLDVTGAFDREIAVPAVRDIRELSNVLREGNVFESQSDVNEALNTIQEYSGGDKVGVGIKTVLTIAESARLAGAEPGQWFAEQLGAQIARNNPRM
jgi:vesicle-fusing ATPase